MELDSVTCYEALKAHDTRFDGAFFVGVGTTGIYCRTVCPAKTPRRENCTFHPSAAAAEQAGYRPCLRCRPELAPGRARIDAVGRLAGSALGRIEDGVLSNRSVAQLAADLGVTERHLRRVIRSEFGVSPIALAQTQRLLLAKRLLTDTALPITEVAFASGFASLRRFNALFQERYRMAPSRLRKGRGAALPPDSLAVLVAYRPPLHWEALLGFLSVRALRGVEAVDGSTYRRTVAIGKHRGWLAVQPAEGRDALRVEVSAGLAPVLLPVLSRVKLLFDLACDPHAVARSLGPLAEAHPGLRVPGAFHGFEVAMRAVLGQQVSVPAASTLAARLVTAVAEPFATPFPELTHLSPSPERLAGARPEELTACGITPARASALVGLAAAVRDGLVSLEPAADVEDAIRRLEALPGIGPWTAQYIAMRAIAWPDAFPHTDLGIRKAMQGDNPPAILRRAEGWRPWRAYAAMHLWKSLEETI